MPTSTQVKNVPYYSNGQTMPQYYTGDAAGIPQDAGAVDVNWYSQNPNLGRVAVPRTPGMTDEQYFKTTRLPADQFSQETGINLNPQQVQGNFAGLNTNDPYTGQPKPGLTPSQMINAKEGTGPLVAANSPMPANTYSSIPGAINPATQSPAQAQTAALQGTSAPASQSASGGSSAPSGYTMQQYQAPQYTPVNLEQYFNQYSQYLAPSQGETQAQGDINNLNASFRAGIQNIEGQPIAMPFVTGQSAAIQKTADFQRQNLTEQLALEQSKRAGMMDMAKARYGFASDEATRQQQASQQAFNQWATQQQLGMQQSGQTYDQWLGQQNLGINQQQLGMSQQQQSFQQKQQEYQNAFLQQGFSADEAYRQAQLRLQQDQNATQSSQFQQGLAQDQQAASTMTPYQQAQTELDYTRQVAALQQQLAGQQKPSYQEVNPGNTLYNTSTNQPVYTAPTSYQQNQTSSPTSSGSSSGGSIVDYLSSKGMPSDFNSRKALAEKNGITNYTGTAAQNTQLLGILRGGTSPSATPSATPTSARTF